MRHGWRVAVVVVMALWCGPASAETGEAVLGATQDGSLESGGVVLSDTPDGLRIVVHVTGVSPGKHGLHIHEFGGCGDAGKGAGGHFNPEGVQHGYLPTDGFGQAHAGDLGNIEVEQDGTGSLAITLRGVTISGGNYSVAGRAIILHAKEDDFGQPTGNAGGRIGCGPIAITGS